MFIQKDNTCTWIFKAGVKQHYLSDCKSSFLQFYPEMLQIVFKCAYNVI